MSVLRGLVHRMSIWIALCVGVAAVGYNLSDFSVGEIAHPAVNYLGWLCFLAAGLASLLLSVAATDQWLLRRATVKQGAGRAPIRRHEV
jgi:hypothetical protein